MLQIERILFPTDFTEHAEHAFAHAARLARQADAEVTVLNVVAPQKPDLGNPLRVLPLGQEDDEAGAPYRFEEKEGVLSGESQAEDDLRVHYRQARCVSPAMGILGYADEHDVDLIVMGTRGRKGLDRFLLSSVAEEVVRHASCPILTVRAHGDMADATGQRLLVPVDFSTHTTSQVAHAAALAETYDAEVHLLHVIDESAFPAAFNPDIGGVLHSDAEARARKALRQLAAGAFPETTTHLHVHFGPPAATILDVADELDAGMLVMATHGRTGLERFFLGSVAEKVVRQAPCPVFTVRSFGTSAVATPAEAAQAAPVG